MAHPALGQGSSDGSIYSRFGLGELRAYTSPQAQGMGGGGTALWSFNYMNENNPASWSDQALTRASAGLLFQGLQATDASQNTSTLTQGALNAVQFGFPLVTRRLGVGLSFAPYSRVSYRVQLDPQFAVDPIANDTSLYVIQYEGNGGLQQISGGLGYRVNPYLAFGASAHFIFGILEDVQRTAFVLPDYRSTMVTRATRLSGVSATGGVMATLPRVLGRDDLLSIAAAFTLPAHLSGSRVRTLGESLDVDTLGVATSGSADVPFGARLGVAYYPAANLTLIADALFEPWSQFDSDLSFPGYTPGGERLTRDRIRLSTGVELWPAGSDPAAPFFQRVAYRLGAFYDRAYVSPNPAFDLNTVALTGGLSIPTMFPGTRLDVNVEVGSRGTTDHGLVRDLYYRIGANVNIGERWFERRKLR
jgi:hypothetical protein